MPGGRPIHGGDVRAALARFGPEGARLDELRALVGDDDAFWTYEELLRACPPGRIGLTSGAHAALFGPLFGEFE
jgi:hypothetical protein